RISAHLVIKEARQAICRARVIKAALIRSHSEPGVTGPGQLIGHVLARVDVKYRNRYFILAAMPYPISEELPVVRDLHHPDRSGQVGAHRIWVYERLIVAVRALPHVHDGLVLIGAPFGKEVAACSLHWGRHGIDLEKLLQALVYLVAARQL